MILCRFENRFTEISMDTIKMYNVLKSFTSEDQAELFVDESDKYIEGKNNQQKVQLKQELATKEDIKELAKEMRGEIRDIHTSLLKQIYLTGIGQIIAVTGLIMGLLKLAGVY